MKFLHFLPMYFLRILPHSVSFPNVGQGVGPEIKTQGQLIGSKSVFQGRIFTECLTRNTLPRVFSVLSFEGPMSQEPIWFVVYHSLFL